MFYLIVGMLPAILLIIYIYKIDSVEKEPFPLLLSLFLLGGFSTIAASLLEEAGNFIATGLIRDQRSVLFQCVMNFLIVGVSEEGVKYLVLRKRTWYRPEFNFRFDAVVYSVSVSLGFAAFENVLYIMNFGLGVAPIRAVTAIPMHCITGIFMGHYYGQAKYCEFRHEWTKMSIYNITAYVVPVLLHGFYDFAAGSESNLLAGIFLAYVVIVDLLAFYSVRSIRSVSMRGKTRRCDIINL